MKTKFVIVGLLCLLACCSQVQAYPVTIEISGTIDFVGGVGIPNTIGVGSTFTGSYTYESTTSVTGEGEYVHDAPYGITLSLGGYEFKTSPSHSGQFVISIRNDSVLSNIHDDYWVESFDNEPLSDGTIIESIHWWLMDTTLAAISSDALPTIAPILTDWNSNQLRIRGGTFGIDGYVTEATLIPEPMSLTLLLSAGVFAIRRKH